jgi:hypothetical protein
MAKHRFHILVNYPESEWSWRRSVMIGRKINSRSFVNIIHIIIIRILPIRYERHGVNKVASCINIPTVIFHFNRQTRTYLFYRYVCVARNKYLFFHHHMNIKCVCV